MDKLPKCLESLMSKKLKDLKTPSEDVITFVNEFLNNQNELSHHGIKGMKWGVRKSKDSVDKISKGVKMNLQYFAKRAGSRKTVHLSIQEYAHVMSELRTNITKEEKLKTIIRKPIGDYMYSFENHFDDTYRVIGKRKIPDTMTGLLERINDGK